MAQLGLSLYPEHSTSERDRAYLELAGRYGFKRVFSCLLSVTETPDKVIKEMRQLTDIAHAHGLEVILDVAPPVFPKLGASYEDLGVFREMGADGIRLDEGFDGHKEARMSYNPEGLKIELNASSDPDHVLNVLAHQPKRENLLACHNFYPQRYTGLGLEHFDDCNGVLKEADLLLAAFVSSNAPDTFGPWAVNEGLCTLEMHRGLPLDFQVRHLFADGRIDDVLIANAFATEAELAACAAVDPAVLTFGLILEKELTAAERDILDFADGHVIRGDLSDYMIRSSRPAKAVSKTPKTIWPRRKKNS